MSPANLVAREAADRLTGRTIDVADPVGPALTRTACTVEDGMPSRSPISTGPSCCRRCTILRTTGVGVRFGCQCDHEDRSTIPAGPSAS